MKIEDRAAKKRPAFAASLVACLSLGLAIPPLVAQVADTKSAHESARDTNTLSGAKPAGQCMTDLRAFDSHLEKDGYWPLASNFGYGYPMYGFGYPFGGYVPVGGTLDATGYGHARPGYEVKTLIAAANILALRGQQQACETLLTATRDVYQDYVGELRNAKATKADVPGWRNHLIASAVQVTAHSAPWRSADLIGIEVVNPHDESLGTVEDVVLSQSTGQVAYLVIGRGGVFGIDEKYVPVPWNAFKMTAGTVLLVLDTTKVNMDTAPRIMEKIFSADVNFGRDNEKADVYWKTHLSL